MAKPREKRKLTGAQAEAFAAATGRHVEPTWNLLAAPSKIELVQALNAYNSRYDHKKKREWALAWIKTNRPELKKNADKAPLYMFGTEAALLRMKSRGMILEDRHEAILESWLTSLGPRVSYEDDEEAPKVKVKRVKVKTDVNMQAFDDVLDEALTNKDAAPEVSAEHPVKTVIAYCDEQLKVIKEDATQYPKHMKKWFKAIMDKLAAIQVVTKTRVVAKRKPRKKDPNKIVKSVKFLKTDHGLKLDGVKPIDVLGKKRLYLYDTKLRKLKKIVATGEGFTFKGTTMLNVDLAKSSIKTVRKPEGTVKSKLGIRELDRVFNSIKGKELAITAVRMNDQTLILGAI